MDDARRESFFSLSLTLAIMTETSVSVPTDRCTRSDVSARSIGSTVERSPGESISVFDTVLCGVLVLGVLRKHWISQ